MINEQMTRRICDCFYLAWANLFNAAKAKAADELKPSGIVRYTAWLSRVNANICAKAAGQHSVILSVCL